MGMAMVYEALRTGFNVWRKPNSEIIADCALWPLWSPDNICCNFSHQSQIRDYPVTSPFIVEVS
jgi:hypothetical protein